MFLLQKNKILLLSLLLLLFIPAVFSLFHQGFFLSDDGNWMVIRFSAFYEALRSGQFPVRFLPRLNFNYGYPVADFLYPLFMYIGVPIHLLGANFTVTIKIIFGLSLLVSGFATFFWLKKSVKDIAAFIGSLIYVFFPYHIFDVYQRGSIGEVLALAIIPLILWQAERKKTVYTGILLGFLILSHNTLAVLFLPFVIGYFLIRKLFSLKQLVGVVVLGFGLSAFFWVAALYDKQFTVFDLVKVSSLSSFFLSADTYYLLGWITVFSLLITIPFLFLRRNITTAYFFILSLFSIFMALPFSNTLWQLSHIAPFFQFPYRFLSLTILCLSYLVAMSLHALPKKWSLVAAFVFLVVIYLSSWNLLFPKTFQYYPDSFYSTNQDSTTVKNEYMPRWVKQLLFTQADSRVSTKESSATITILQNKGSKITFQATTRRDSVVFVNIVDFPGWKATIDGIPVVISHNNQQGLITIIVPKGSHIVTVTFSETPLRLFADFVSLLSLVIASLLLIKRKHER